MNGFLFIFKPFIAMWKMRYNYLFGDRKDNEVIKDKLIDDISFLSYN